MIHLNNTTFSWKKNVYTRMSNGRLFSFLLIQEQASASDSGKGEGTHEGEKILTRCREQWDRVSLFLPAERGKDARAHTVISCG